MSTFCLQPEKSASLTSTSKLNARIAVSHNAITKISTVLTVSPKLNVIRGAKSSLIASSKFISQSKLSNGVRTVVNNVGTIRTTPKFTLNLASKAKSSSKFKDAKTDKFAGNIDRIKQLTTFNSTQKLYPIRDIVTSLNNSYFVTKNLQTNNLYAQIDEGVVTGQYVQSGKNSSLVSDERDTYIHPSSIFTKGDFRYKFEVTRPNNIEESFLFIRAAAPVSNYSSNIPPQYRLHNIKLEDPSGNLIIKYKDITIRGDADYNTDYVNFATYISEPETNNLKLNLWDINYPLMDLPSGYSLNIDFAIDCLDDPFSQGFDKGYEDTCKLDFVNSSNNNYLSLDGSPLSTQSQNFSLNPTNSLRISAIEIVNSGGVGVLEGNSLKFYTEVNSVGQRLTRNILPAQLLEYNTDLEIYPAASSVWQSSSDDFGNFGINSSPSGSKLLLSKLQDSSYNNYIKLIYSDPINDSGRLTLKFSHKTPTAVDSLVGGDFNLGYNTNYNKSFLQSIQEIDSFFTVDGISLKIIAKKENSSVRDYCLDVIGFSDDKLLNITPKVNAFLQNANAGIGNVPTVSGFNRINDLGIATQSFSDKSQYFESDLITNPAGDHYKLSTTPLVTGTTFQEYTIPLAISSSLYSNSSNFENLYLDIYNLPSGAVLSTVQLVFTYKPSNGLTLHTLAQEQAKEYAKRNITLYPSPISSGQKLLNSYLADGPLSNVNNIPHGFSELSTLKTNYSRRWRCVDGLVVDGPYNINQFDFGFDNPALNTPFLNGYFTFNSDQPPFIISDNITNQNQPLSGVFIGSYEKVKNIGLRLDPNSLFNESTQYKSIDWTRISGYENHELRGKIYDAYDNALRVNGNNKYIKFDHTPIASGFSVYLRFTPDKNISGVNYNYFNSGILFSKWDNGKNLEFALGYQGGYLCGLARTNNGNVVTVTDTLKYDQYQYPLSVILTYNDNLSQKLRLYTDNEIANNFNVLRGSSSSFAINQGDSSLCFGYSSGSGVGINAYIHELGISTYNESGTNIVYNNPLRLLKQNTADSFLRGHRGVIVNDPSKDVAWSYIDGDTYSWNIGDFKVRAFSADFGILTKRDGTDFIIHTLDHSGSGYNIASQIDINHSGISYHSQIENDFLRFNLSDIPESENFYSTYPRICKTLPRSYNFEKESIVVETIIEHETNNNILWNDGKIGPKFIVSLYTKNQDPQLLTNKKNWGLINRSIHHLDPSGSFTKLLSYLNYENLTDSSEPWAIFDKDRNITEFDHKYFSKDINDMFLQYDVVYPSGSPFKSSIKIHSANIKLENAIRKSDLENNSINLITSGDLIALGSTNLYCYGKDAVNDNVVLYIDGSPTPSIFDSLDLYSSSAYYASSNMPLFVFDQGLSQNSLPIFVTSRSDKSDEKLLNLTTINKLEDQTALNYVPLIVENKIDKNFINNNLNFSILSSSRVVNKFPNDSMPLSVAGFKPSVLSSIYDSIPLYIDSIGLTESAFDSVPLFAMNYPSVNPLFKQQEVIVWNSKNSGKNIDSTDNSKSFLVPNDEIRGVDELICYGECSSKEPCEEQAFESHSLPWESENTCVDGGILRAKNTYTNLQVSGFKTEVPYSGNFYGIRKYDGLVPNSPYSVILEAQTGNNRSIKLPFEFTEVEYGSNDYVNYSGVKITDSAIQTNDGYGKSVSIKNNLMAIGAPYHALTYQEYDSNNNLVNGTSDNAGTVFVYRREDRPSGNTWPIDKDKSPWYLETKLMLPSGMIKDYYISNTTDIIGNVQLPLSITEKRWKVGQEGREFGYSVAIGVNSGIKSFEEDKREIIVVGGPNAKWTPREFEDLQTSGVQIGVFVFTDEFTPTVSRKLSNKTEDYENILSNVQNKDLIFKYFSDPPVSFDVKIVICEPLSDYANRTALNFSDPPPNFITKKVISRKQGVITEERVDKIVNDIKEAFHEAFPYDTTKLNNNIPAMLGVYVDNTRSMRNAIDGQTPALNKFINYYKQYSFASGLKDFYGTASSGEVVRYTDNSQLHWIDATNKTLDYVLDTGRLLVDNQVRFFTSGVGQEAFNSNLSAVNYPPDSGGKVFIFEKESGVWNLIQQLSATNIIYDHPDRFGYSVAISDNTEVISIGSPYISESCQAFEFKPQEKIRLMNELFTWLSYKSSLSGGIGKYANLISDYYSWVAKYGYDYSNRVLYSKLTYEDKFEARRYLNIEEYKKIFSYSQGQLVGSSKWDFIADEFLPTARLGYSTAVNEDGSIIAFGAPTDSLNRWDDARVYYKNAGYYNPTDQSINTANIIPSWRSNVNAGAVRVFDSRKYHPQSLTVDNVKINKGKVIEYGRFGNLQKELNLPEDSGHFNYLPTIFSDREFLITPFSQTKIPEDVGLAFIITPSVDALSDEVAENIISWLALGDRNLVLVGNDPIWENDGAYAQSNEIINKILARLDSRMKLYPAKNINEACLTIGASGISTYVENATSTTIKRENVNLYGTADIRTNFDTFFKTGVMYSDCSSSSQNLGNLELFIDLPTANDKCELPIKNNGDLRAQWKKYCLDCQGRRQPHYINLPYFFSTFTPSCGCDPDETFNQLASSRINAPNQEPVPILAAAKYQTEITVIPSSQKIEYESEPVYINTTITKNSKIFSYDENNVFENPSFVWSKDNPASIQYLANPNNIVQPNGGVLQIIGSPTSQQTIIKKEVATQAYFCAEENLYESKIIGIAGIFLESESELYNAGLNRTFDNDDNINFYVNLVAQSNGSGSRIKFLTSSWVGRSDFIDANENSQLRGLFLDNDNIVEYSDTIYSYDDVCWIANPLNLPSSQQVASIKQWLSIGNKKLIITHDNTDKQITLTNSLFNLLGSQIRSTYLPVDDTYAKIKTNEISLSLTHPVSIGFDSATSIKKIKLLDKSYEFVPFSHNSNIIPIAFTNETVYDTQIITNGFWELIGKAIVSFPTVVGSGYKIFIDIRSDNEYESQNLTIRSVDKLLSKEKPTLPPLPSGGDVRFTSNNASSNSISFNIQAEKLLTSFEFSSDIPVIRDVVGYIPKTPKIISMSGVMIPIKESIASETFTTPMLSGYKETIKNIGPIEPEKIVTRQFFDVIQNDNTQYCSEDCAKIPNFTKKLIADGPVVVAQEREHITSFSAGYNRSTITLISDSAIVQGRYLPDNEGRIPQSTINFLTSLYPATVFASNNSGRQFNQQTKLVAPERGSPQKYLSLVSNSGLNYRFGNPGTIPVKNPNGFNKLESNYDPRFVKNPLPPWNDGEDDVQILIKKNQYLSAFRNQENEYGAKSKFTEIIDGVTYKDTNKGLPQLLKDKGYDHIDFDRLPSGYPGDLFGYSIAIYKDKVIVGAPFSAFSNENINPWQQYVNGGSSSGIELSYNGGAGAVYIFEKTFKGSGLHGSLAPWECTQKLRPQSINIGQDVLGVGGFNSIVTDQFGRSVSIDSDIISVSAPGHDFGNLYINGSGNFIRKCFNEEFDIPSRNVIDLGSSGTRSQLQNSGNPISNQGAIFVFENKVQDWKTKTKKWTFAEKIIQNSGLENSMLGTKHSMDRLYRSDADYSFIGSCSNVSGVAYSTDIILRQPSPAMPSPSAYIQARVFGERYDIHPTGQPSIYISVSNNNEDNGKHFASGIIYSDEKGQIFIEASGYDPINKGFIDHRPFIASVNGKYQSGAIDSGSLTLFMKSAENTTNNMPLFTRVDNTAIVYNNLGLFNSAIIDVVSNLPSGLNLYVNPDPVSVSNSGLGLFASGIGSVTDTLNMRIRGRA